MNDLYSYEEMYISSVNIDFVIIPSKKTPLMLFGSKDHN